MMPIAWRYAVFYALGSLVMVAAGLWMIRGARQMNGLPQQLEQATAALAAAGGEEGLAERSRRLTKIHHLLRQELAAKGSSSGDFSRRIEQVFLELGLTVAASSEWRADTDNPVDRGAVFERTFQGSGGFAEFLEAVHTLESWPDQVRVRTLTLTPEAPGTVAFTLGVAAVRLERSAAETPTTDTAGEST